MKSNYLYLLVDFGSIVFPFAFSFYPRANFSKKWKHLWPAIALSAVLFIFWDVVFTHLKIWGFNSDYVTGLYFFNLPIEEVLFFICIPYSCVFLYEAVKYFTANKISNFYTPIISTFLIVVLFSMGVFNLDRLYTSITFFLTSIFLATVQWKWKFAYLGTFYFSFLFMLIPFFLVNGILTGSFTDQPVVWYNAAKMMSIRIGTIPVEDIFYGMLLLLLNIVFFEKKIDYRNHKKR